MSSVCLSFTFGLVIAAGLLKRSSGLPVPGAPLLPLPRRFIDQNFDKDIFKDGHPLEFPEIPKRTFAQQAHENAKKLPVRHGPPHTGDLYDNNFYNPNQFKEQDPWGLLDANIQQEILDDVKKHPTSHEVEGYYPEEKYADEEEEETKFEPIHPAEPSLVNPYFGADNNQLNYPLPNNGYSVYIGSDTNKVDYAVEAEAPVDVGANSDDDDKNYDIVAVTDTNANPAPAPSPQQPLTSSNRSPPKAPQLPQQQKQPQPPQPPQQPKQPQPPPNPPSELNTLMTPGVEMNASDHKLKVREPRSNKHPVRNIQPPPRPLLMPPEPRTVVPIEVKPIIVDEPAVIAQTPVKSGPQEIFSRTTTITKTTKWYLNEENEVVVLKDMEDKHRPLKVKYDKAIKTTTSGPIPWYLQGFEDVIFEEENVKSKTILDKMADLRGMNPTSITSFTTAPNPWSSEVHEEVVLVEVLNYKESKNEVEAKGPHPSQLEHIVDYLPRTQVVREEIEVPVRERVKNIEEIVVIDDLGEVLLEIVPPDVVPQSHPIPPPNQYYHSTQVQPIQPVMHSILPHEKEVIYEDEYFVQELLPDYRPYQENHHSNDLQIPVNPNQLTTSKPLVKPTPPSMENSFTPHPQVLPHPGLEQNHLQQQPYNHPNTAAAPQPQHPPLYGNHPQQPNREQHGTVVRRDKPRDPRGEHHQPQVRENHPRQTGEHPEPPRSPVKSEPVYKEEQARHLRGEPEGKHPMSPSEGKRPMYQNRQPQQQQYYPNRQARARDL